MSKIYLVGDIHLGLGYPNKTDKWFKIHKEYFKDFLIPFLKKEVSDGDIIVQLGDLFDNRNVLPINILNYAMDVVEEISSIAPLHILIGNHDLYTRSASEINSVRLFKHIPNVSVYDSPSKINYNGKCIGILPYIESRIDQISHMNNLKPCDYLFCHSDLNGVKMHLTSVAHRNNDKIDVSEFSGFDKVRTGHIHLTQEIDNIKFVGSIFQMDRNDYDNQKGIYVLDTNDDSEIFIKNNISPIFIKYKILTDTDIDGLEPLINSKDFIDISISNKLLVSSRKLRRKIENILEQGSFESIDYIDDILIEKSNIELDVVSNDNNNDNIDISLQLDYAEYIREYISKQKYDSDEFINGIVGEYNNIIDIYNSSYLKVN